MTTTSNTVVLIHGLWMTPLAWEHWVTRYEARGFTVLTPGYPGIGQGEAGLQAHSTAIAAHRVFPGRDRYTRGEPGWEEVADFALDWALAPVPGVLG